MIFMKVFIISFLDIYHFGTNFISVAFDKLKQI